jgi:hypothetical protein
MDRVDSTGSPNGSELEGALGAAEFPRRGRHPALESSTSGRLRMKQGMFRASILSMAAACFFPRWRARVP